MSTFYIKRKESERKINRFVVQYFGLGNIREVFSVLINSTLPRKSALSRGKGGTSGNLYTAAKIVVHSSKTNVTGESRHSD